MDSPSDQERWLRVEALFHRLVDLTPAEQRAMLDRECVADRELRETVSELLANADSEFDYSTLIGQSASDFLASPPDEPPPSIGHYRVLRCIGQGGMGRVFLAARDDDQYEQQVAIKLINQSVIDNERVLRLFQEERQILANLQHPNVTRLLDGGSLEDGSPFLVMEYVQGEPIDKYCDREALSLDQRLALFVKVCEAVQYAHRNLVVHRDLKPSNIAVNGDGEPKLMDFGVAKLLNARNDPQNPQTELADRVLTPQYASPEQLLGEPVSTVSDVYALGVILHELLVGKRPFDGPDRGPYAYARRVTESDAPLPGSGLAAKHEADSIEQAPSPIPGMSIGQLRRRLRGDLDSIVLMALSREPARRYQSAAELAADIENYRARRPVRAGRPTGSTGRRASCSATGSPPRWRPGFWLR